MFYCKKSVRKIILQTRTSLFIFYVVQQSIFLEIADVLATTGIERKIANSRNQRINFKSDYPKEKISAGSRFPALRFQIGMIDNKTADESEEKSQQKSDQISRIRLADDRRIFQSATAMYANFCVVVYFVTTF